MKELSELQGVIIVAYLDEKHYNTGLPDEV